MMRPHTVKTQIVTQRSLPKNAANMKKKPAPSRLFSRVPGCGMGEESVLVDLKHILVHACRSVDVAVLYRIPGYVRRA